MEVLHHPNITLFWNWFPIDILIPWPIKLFGNVLLLVIYPYSIFFYSIWNLIPESIIGFIWLLLSISNVI